MKTLLRWTQRMLFASAILLLGYCAFVLVDGRLFRNREARELAQFRPDRPATLQPVSGGLVGQIAITRLGVATIVMEGVDDTTLRRAAGHIPGTGLPGQIGNIGIAAHRDTFFRPLRNIRQSDIITLTTLSGAYRYRVVSTRVVNPSDVSALQSDGREVLTLVTCFPFYFIGAAPKRFIVRAERVT
jgi:sortase A